MEPAGEFVWDVRVAATATNVAHVFVRKHQFDVGVPLSFDREEERATALETALGALGAEIVVGLRRVARKHRLVVDDVEATVQARLRNALVYLGVIGEEGDPGIRQVRIRVYVTTAAPAAAVERVWQEVLATSPLICTFRHAVDLELTYKIIL
ncbi:MAG TPA: OsmC family protein [Candidatus Krumholzibacteria bacterium]|nr:OsmC family protein [Candidatus Krumholzibacteria bacterium]